MGCGKGAFAGRHNQRAGVGIDIGSLDACVMAGYAGSIASTWQRAGRAGRRSGTSCAVFVASSAPLDQFIVQHPDYFFGSSPEHDTFSPTTLRFWEPLKCAAFELPLSPDEKFGGVDLPIFASDLLTQVPSSERQHWHWVQESYPADTISLRSVTSDNFIIIDITGGDAGKPEVIGEVDFTSALTTVHEKAIYIHQDSSTMWTASSLITAKPMSSVSTSTTTPTPFGTHRCAFLKLPKN